MDQASGLRKLKDEIALPTKASISVVKKSSAKIYAVSSGKGGVGKTTVTVNLAIALAKANKKVLVLDGDLGLANINVILGIIPKFTLYHVIKGHKSLQEVVLETAEGIDIIPGASGYSQLADLDSTARESLIQNIMEINDYDYILIDTGAGIGSIVISLILAADEVLIVTTPEPTSITDSYGLIKSITNRNKDFKLNVVINKAKDELEGKKVARRVIDISQKFLNVLPFEIGLIYRDEEVERSILAQKPFLITAPRSKASDCMMRLSQQILNTTIETPAVNDENRLTSYFRRFFHLADHKDGA